MFFLPEKEFSKKVIFFAKLLTNYLNYYILLHISYANLAQLARARDL